MSFPARFRGECAECLEGFPEGAVIEEVRPGSRRYRHAGVCPEPEPTVLDLRPSEVVCPSCWTVHPPGDCS